LLLSVEPAGVNATLAPWPIDSLVPGGTVLPELDAEVVLAVVVVPDVAVVVALDAAGAAAPLAPEDEELLPPHAATPPASASAASAAPIDVPRSLPIIITPWNSCQTS
jgi:hypothetical protein